MNDNTSELQVGQRVLTRGWHGGMSAYNFEIERPQALPYRFGIIVGVDVRSGGRYRYYNVRLDNGETETYDGSDLLALPEGGSSRL